MPGINLTRKNFEGGLESQKTINELYAYMVWPNNEKKRLDLIHISNTRCFAIMLDEASKNEELIPANLARKLYQIAWDCPPRSIESEEEGILLEEGMYLAATLLNSLNEFHLNNKRITFWGKDNGMFIDLLGKRFKKGTSKQNIQRIWHRIRPVAHLYLARQHLANINPKLQMPCDEHRLVNFIALAEGYRKIGEELKPYNSKEPYIPPDKSYKIIMPNNEIPAAKLEWQ